MSDHPVLQFFAEELNETNQVTLAMLIEALDAIGESAIEYGTTVATVAQWASAQIATEFAGRFEFDSGVKPEHSDYLNAEAHSPTWKNSGEAVKYN